MAITSIDKLLSRQAKKQSDRPLIPLYPMGMSAGFFLMIAYVACVILYLLFPDLFLRHAVLPAVFPGFTLLTWQSFFLGLVASFGYGWVFALIFVPLFNFFSAKQGRI